MAAEQIEALKGLLERVRGATGPDRQLDAQILCTLLAPKTAFAEQSRINGAWCIYVPNAYQPAAQARLWEMPMPWRFEHAGITASVDAALALMDHVLPGWDAHIYRDDDDGGRVAAEMVWPPGTDIGDAGYFGTDGRGATRPLAIVEGILASKLALLEAQNAAKAAPPLTRSENDGGRS